MKIQAELRATKLKATFVYKIIVGLVNKNKLHTHTHTQTHKYT